MTKTLFLAWQDKGASRQWFPVGRLDGDPERSGYRFRYIGGAERAQAEAGFPLLLEFPELRRDYRASQLFPLFRNRVINRRRPDLGDHLRRLGLTTSADPFEVMSTSGGYRATDSYEVFPKLVKATDGGFRCRFFLQGWRHVNQEAQKRLGTLEGNERLGITLELTNPTGPLAVQIQTTDYHMIGWAPRYLVRDLAEAMADGPTEYAARVVRVNPLPAPSKQRVLIEMTGRWKRHEPMSGEDYRPLVGD